MSVWNTVLVAFWVTATASGLTATDAIPSRASRPAPDVVRSWIVDRLQIYATGYG